MAVTLCNGCGVGDHRRKHAICYSQDYVPSFHPECCPEQPCPMLEEAA